ncbi:glycosyltransferase, partial [Neobacillus drentensis]|uniref:glycosyltransferase n=1 Tax=Neobacillus drentensis TaxID=220684 RepID=UPI002FFD9DED
EVKIYQNEVNMGSNKTFEKLTAMSKGDFIAYCDQDDIWEEDKLSVLVNTLLVQNALVCYSDLSIIDDHDKFVASSFKKISKRLNHIYGEKTYGYFLRRNSITGCTMLINSRIAKESLPFPNSNEYVHDHWLALFASCKGNIAYVERPLIRYRIHANNQIGAKVLSGIETKEDYITKKLQLEKNKVEYVNARNLGNDNSEIQMQIEHFQEFVNNRIAFFENKGLKNTILFLRNITFDPVLISFELLINLLPNFLSNKLITKAKS